MNRSQQPQSLRLGENPNNLRIAVLIAEYLPDGLAWPSSALFDLARTAIDAEFTTELARPLQLHLE